MSRVLHVISDLLDGGAATQLRLLAEHAASQGEPVTIATLRWPGPAAEAWRQRGARVTWLGRRFRFDPLAAERLRRVVRRFRPDVLQSWDAAAAAFCRLASGGPRRPAWIHTVRDPNEASAIARRADVVVCPDDATADVVRPYVDTPDRIAIVPNGIHGAGPVSSDADPDAVRRASRARLRTAGVEVPDDAPVLVTALRADDAVRLKETVWASDLVRVVRPGVRLLVVGDGAARVGSERFGVDATAPGVVQWLGQWNDLATAYAAADVAWCGNQGGAAPTPALEAAASGLPVVIAAGPGRDELWRAPDGEPVDLCPRWDDRAGWARATDRLLGDVELRRRVADAVRERALAGRSVSDVARRHADAVSQATTIRSAA